MYIKIEMDIVIIGSGNVASVLGRKFKAAKHNILQVVSRNAPKASALAYELDTESTNYWSMINRMADVYIIAVSDEAIVEVCRNIKLQGKIVAHTAAAVSKDVLKKVTDHYGVFYPLQSLRKDMQVNTDIPLFVDGIDELTVNTLSALARSISTQQVSHTNDEERSRLHVAAVVSGNFTNYLYTLAEEYCRKEGIEFRLLLPLIQETALRIQTVSPRAVQTGPAIRHDQETIDKHLALLADHHELKKVYQFLSESIAARK